MAHTDLYRKQHKEILDIAGRLKPLLDTKALGLNAAPAGDLLRQLGAKLRVHLTTEDKGLFPQLLAHPIVEVRAKAQHYHGELVTTLKAFTEYFARYPTASAIQVAPAGFAKDSHQFLDRLVHQLATEERDLYDLVDRSY